MRAAAVILLAACSSSSARPDAPAPEAFASLVAVRPRGGDWQVIEPACGTPIAVPAGAYELVHVSYSMTDPARAGINVTQAGPGDPLPSIPCPKQFPSLAERTVTLLGATQAGFSGFSQSAGVMAPRSVMLLDDGPSDVVAMTEDGTGLYLLQRAVSLTQSGLLLDFGTFGRPVETRAVAITGIPPNTPLQDFTVEMTTAGGVMNGTGANNQGYPTSFAMIPTSALIPGDTEHASALWAEGSYANPHTVDVDLVAHPPGPITMDMPPAPDTVAVTSDPTTLDVMVTASWTFNELSAGMQRGFDADQQTWKVTMLPGWNDVRIHVTGLTSIPGWMPGWSWAPGMWGGTACDDQGGTRRCAGKPATM